MLTSILGFHFPFPTNPSSSDNFDTPQNNRPIRGTTYVGIIDTDSYMLQGTKASFVRIYNKITENHLN